MNPTSKERSPGVDLSALREALAKATPEPWTREKPGADENGWPSGVAVAGTPGRQTIYASPPGGCFPSADCDLIVLLRNTAPALIAELEAARAEVARLRECVAINATKGAKVVNDLLALQDWKRRADEALRTIADWKFPDSGKRWEDGTAMSYGAAFGSNGERDYMRRIAQEALRPTDTAGSAGEKQP